MRGWNHHCLYRQQPFDALLLYGRTELRGLQESEALKDQKCTRRELSFDWTYFVFENVCCAE